MIEPPDENDNEREVIIYLHFEDDDLSAPDVYFDSFAKAVEFINDRGWGFVTEDWERYCMFEARIECRDQHGVVVGQLLMLEIKLTE